MKTARQAHDAATALGVAKHIRKAIKQAVKSGKLEVEVYDSVLEPFTVRDLQNLEFLGYIVLTKQADPYWRRIKWSHPTK
jgi:hypothetical protein